MTDIDGKDVIRIESWLDPQNLPGILSIIMVTGEVQERSNGDR